MLLVMNPSLLVRAQAAVVNSHRQRQAVRRGQLLVRRGERARRGGEKRQY